MKRFMPIWMATTAMLVLSSIAVSADSVTPVATHSNGNQLTQNSAHWYEKSAETIGPVEGFKAKSGASLILQPGSSVYMNGKSTLHDYQMNAHILKGSAVLKGSSKDLMKSLKSGRVGSMTLVVPVSGFKSRESGLDDNAYKALNAKVYPEIQFKLTSETLKAGATAGAYVMTAPGTLTVMGQTIPIILTADATFKDGQVRIKGSQKLKFTDFKIKPPSASVLIVTITCSDEFEVYYDVLFGPSAK